MQLLSKEKDILPIREQYRIFDEILLDRIQNLMPRLMRECGVDMWLVICREYAEDPVFKTLTPMLVKNASRTSCFLFSLDARGNYEALSLSRPDPRLFPFYKQAYDPKQESQFEAIRRAVEGSLQRLRTDHIDLYFQHRIDPKVEPETVAEVMAELIREGKITHWGISEAGEDYLRRAHAVCPVTAVENRYSMMARQYESLFPVLEELRVGLVAFSPMANGFLTGAYGKESRFDPKLDYRSAMPQFTPQAVDQNQELLALLRELAQAKNATPAQISLAWMLCKKPWIVPIPGSRRLDRMKENAGAAEVLLTPAEVAALDRRLDAIPMSAVFGGSRVAARGSSGPT